MISMQQCMRGIGAPAPVLAGAVLPQLRCVGCPRHRHVGKSQTAVRRLGQGHVSVYRRDASVRSTAFEQGAFSEIGAVASHGVPVLPPVQGPVLVWFKADLRTADHPGLLAAVQRAAADGVAVIPFFCLDPQLYADLALTPQGPEALVTALSCLREGLRAAGSDLVVRVGPADFTLAAFTSLVGAGALITELEQDTRWLSAAAAVSAQLHRQAGPHPPMVTWTAPAWPSSRFQPNFRRWQSGRGNALPPLPPPSRLPPLPEGIDPGVLPSVDSVRRLLRGALTSGINQQRRCLSVLRAMLQEVEEQPVGAAVGQLLEAVQQEAAQQQQTHQQPQTADSSSWSSWSSSSVGGEAGPMGAALAAYLAGGGGEESRWAFLGPAISAAEAPSARGASFPALLGALFLLGALSPRQVHAAVLAHEAGRWGGLPPPFSLAGPAVRAALAAVELADFHRQLAAPGARHGLLPAAEEPVVSASASYDEGPQGVLDWGGGGWAPGTPVRCHWRWRGALTDYCVAEPAMPRPGAPALLLVHGFGAFGDQWRGNMAALAAAGYSVYAPTLPGFGRSEKAALTYSQECWRDYLRDFVVRVVRRPVVLAGNSIGGFISASVAADYPALVKGLVLLNSAGPIDPGFDPSAHAALPPRTPPPPWVARGLTAGLMAYLENSIAGQLKWLYPTNPAAADPWLEEEIFRAACDLRSADVFGAVFYLPPPRALNYMVSALWRGPTLVLQGVLDPLNDAAGRARQMQELCPNVQLQLLQAGHCPHDEVPEQVNAGLLSFAEQFVPAPPEEAPAAAEADPPNSRSYDRSRDEGSSAPGQQVAARR